jgi:hypothetical protein
MVGLSGWVRRMFFVGLTALPFAIGSGCGGEDKPPPLDRGSGGGGSGGSNGGVGGSGGGAGGAPDGSGAADAEVDVDAGDPTPPNCGDGGVVCRGHSKCVVEGSAAECVCDQGYVRLDGECVVDESCIKLRYLDDSCRQVLNGRPGVGLFFAVDYCAGTAVLPDKLGELSTAFRILEDGLPLGPESFATVIPRDVENYVTLAVDVSSSVLNNPGLLAQLTTELRSFVQSLTPLADEAPVAVSVLIFGRTVVEYVPFTANLQAVDAALETLQTSRATIEALVNIDGTALNASVKEAIHATERIQRLRSLVTEAGVLTTGVAVIVTDGGESTTTDPLDTTLVSKTLVNVISIGISSAIDDAVLSAIGRDGSFLAPTTADMTLAFSEIRQRVKEAPDRAYLLAYCTSRNDGTSTVTVSLNGVTPKQTAGCTFNASLFSRDPAARCTLEWLGALCAGQQCGGLLACGACASDQCCGGDGQCHGPAATSGDCRAQDELCQASDLVCVKPSAEPASCVAPQAEGAPCSTTMRCDPGTTYCGTDTDTCFPVVLANGQDCAENSQPKAERCPELNCARENPDNASEPHVCQPAARMFDLCSGASAAAVCESGTSCRSGTCQARKPLASSCSTDLECRTGRCDTTGRRCIDTAECFFSWNQKVQ